MRSRSLLRIALISATLAGSVTGALAETPAHKPTAGTPAQKSDKNAKNQKSEKSKEKDKDKDKNEKSEATPADQPKPDEAAPPYEPQLLRLSELLGALAYLQDLCGHHQGDVWRAKMAALLDTEAKTPLRKQRLAGAFNRGFEGYALTYRLCTPNAQAIITRFLAESGEIAHDVARRYGPS